MRTTESMNQPHTAATLIGFLTPELLRMLESAPDNPIPAPLEMPMPISNIDRRTGFLSEYRPEWNRPTDPKWQSDFRRAMSIVRSGGMVALVGPRGTGKTQMAAEIARDFAPETARYAVWALLYARFLAAGRNGPETDYDVLQDVCNAKLLVLDEIHEKYGSDAAGTEREQKRLTTICDQRYGNRRPVVLITNENKAGFLKGLPDSVFSRFQQIGEVIEFSGPSWRGKR